MSDSSNFAFGKLVPGFDFLQNLAASAAKGQAQAMPQMPDLGHWVAPTMNLQDIDKRIGELKAVQFWLDQNAVALKATIQALEVQKMSLSALKSMNFNWAGAPAGAEPGKARTGKNAAAGAAQVDPMQWWGALTQQFQTIAAGAMKDLAQQASVSSAAGAPATSTKATPARAKARRRAA